MKGNCGMLKMLLDKSFCQIHVAGSGFRFLRPKAVILTTVRLLPRRGGP